MLSSDICVAITNYDFSENADSLKREFAKHLPTILIDASSPVRPQTADVQIENTYYPGLWNYAVRYAETMSYTWLMFIASDLQITDIEFLCQCATETTLSRAVGVYTPSALPGSRVSVSMLANRPSGGVRECGLVEGFMFLARTDLLTEMYPLPATNKYGWGADIRMCYIAYRRNLCAVVDDRVKIFHPQRPVPTPRLDLSGPDDAARIRRLAWSTLLRRAWGIDALACPRCDGAMRMIAVIEDARVARQILKHLGLSFRPPPRGHPAGTERQQVLFDEPRSFAD